MPDNFFSASRCRVFTYYDSYVQQLSLFEKKEGDRLKEKSIHSFRRKPNVLHVGNLSTKPGLPTSISLIQTRPFYTAQGNYVFDTFFLRGNQRQLIDKSCIWIMLFENLSFEVGPLLTSIFPAVLHILSIYIYIVFYFFFHQQGFLSKVIYLTPNPVCCTCLFYKIPRVIQSYHRDVV